MRISCDLHLLTASSTCISSPASSALIDKPSALFGGIWPAARDRCALLAFTFATQVVRLSTQRLKFNSKFDLEFDLRFERFHTLPFDISAAVMFELEIPISASQFSVAKTFVLLTSKAVDKAYLASKCLIRLVDK